MTGTEANFKVRVWIVTPRGRSRGYGVATRTRLGAWVQYVQHARIVREGLPLAPWKVRVTQ